MDGSDISVVLPTYQDADHLGDALASIADQTVPPREVIVVDDGSTDDTPKVVAEFAGAHPELEVHFLESDRNTGIAAARNRGLEVATGSWVAMQDSDDVWLPPKLERQLALIEQWSSSRRLVAVSTWGLNVNDRLEPVSATRSGPIGEAAYDEIRARGQLFFCLQASMLLRREDLLAIDGYRVDCYAVEDLEMLDRLAVRGVITGVPEELVLYRKRSDSVQAATARRQEAAIDRLGLNVRRRAHGQPDLTLEEYAVLRAAEPWRRRWVRRARAEGKHHYRRGSVLSVNGHRVRGAAHLGVAAVLDPQRVVGGMRTAWQSRVRRS